MFDFTRRAFLKGLAATAAVSAFGIDLKDLQGKKPKLITGVVSDVHITSVESCNYWEKALKWFDQRGADAVLVAGDIADLGQVQQLKNFADAWYKVFPNDMSASGRKVERFFTLGNHDWEGQHYGGWQGEARQKMLDNCIKKDRPKAWDFCFHEEFQGIIRKEIKGYTFIGAHWPDHTGIEDYMNKAVASIDPKLPFFYTQHPHPKDTCYGSWAWGHDNGASTRAFSKFPNALVFTGHSHYPLSEECGIWQDTFTSIGTSSLRYIDHRYGRENGDEQAGMISQMPHLSTWGNEGMLVSVYDECVVIERYSFSIDRKVGPDWILPTPLCQEKPYNHQKRIAEMAANPPAFPKDASKMITVKEIIGKNRAKQETKQVVVEFPTALEGGRQFDYEVRPEFTLYDVTQVMHSKRVYAEKYYLPLDMQAKTATCVFSYDELPVMSNNRKIKVAKIRFVITPLDCFGNRGKSIVSAPFAMKGVPTEEPKPAANGAKP